MNFLEQIQAHTSIRAFKTTAIPQPVIDNILHSTIRASTSGNIQPYSIIVTKDQMRKQELWKLHHEQDMILQAPLLLTFCCDWSRMIQWCENSNAKPAFDNFLAFMVGSGDTFIASQNAALAAEAQGLGICFMGTTLNNASAISDFLKLPKHVVPITTLVIGYADESPEPRDRLPLDGVVHDEYYKPYSDDDISWIYDEKETAGWDRYMTFPDLRERIEKSDVQNLAQIYTDLKYTKEKNVEAARNLFDLVQKQGFFNQETESEIEQESEHERTEESTITPTLRDLPPLPPPNTSSMEDLNDPEEWS
jgi:nitroreductase